MTLGGGEIHLLISPGQLAQGLCAGTTVTGSDHGFTTVKYEAVFHFMVHNYNTCSLILRLLQTALCGTFDLNGSP